MEIKTPESGKLIKVIISRVTEIFKVSLVRGTAFSSSAATVAATATLIKAENTSRVGLMIYNNDTTNPIYIGDSTVTTLTGTPVHAKSHFVIENTTAAVYGICAAGTINVRVIET